MKDGVGIISIDNKDSQTWFVLFPLAGTGLTRVVSCSLSLYFYWAISVKKKHTESKYLLWNS